MNKSLNLAADFSADVGADEEAIIHDKWQIEKRVEEYLTLELGMPPPSEPQFPVPALSLEQLTTPDSKDYTESYLQHVAWHGYYSEVWAKHKTHILCVEAEMEEIRISVKKKLRSNAAQRQAKAPSSAELEDRAREHPRYAELRQELVFQKAVAGRLEAAIETLDRKSKLLSRQVEIRRQDFEHTGRGSNISGKGGIPNQRAGMRYPSSGTP